MRKYILILSLSAISFISYSQDISYVDNATVTTGNEKRNNWGAKMKSPDFHLGLDVQTKYMWRGMEMMADESAPVLFPNLNFQWNGIYVYAMGGYAINGKYAEVDLGISYSWKGFTIGFNDYYYPTTSGKDDEYLGGGHNGHWLEACITYSPANLPLWISASNFFCGDDDVYEDEHGNRKQAYSTYLEVGTYYDFLENNKLSLAVGVTPGSSCYTDYKKNFSVCNIDLKYTYNVNFKSGWNLPLNVEYIYNPSFNKSYINFIANIVF